MASVLEEGSRAVLEVGRQAEIEVSSRAVLEVGSPFVPEMGSWAVLEAGSPFVPEGGSPAAEGNLAFVEVGILLFAEVDNLPFAEVGIADRAPFTLKDITSPASSDVRGSLGLDILDYPCLVLKNTVRALQLPFVVHIRAIRIPVAYVIL